MRWYISLHCRFRFIHVHHNERLVTDTTGSKLLDLFMTEGWCLKECGCTQLARYMNTTLIFSRLDLSVFKSPYNKAIGRWAPKIICEFRKSQVKKSAKVVFSSIPPFITLYQPGCTPGLKDRNARLRKLRSRNGIPLEFI